MKSRDPVKATESAAVQARQPAARDAPSIDAGPDDRAGSLPQERRIDGIHAGRRAGRLEARSDLALNSARASAQRDRIGALFGPQAIAAPARAEPAQRAFAARVHLRHDRIAPAAAAARAAPVQREMAVQITSDIADQIASIEIIGRPHGWWSDTMGDHTTAFIVHVEGLRQMLQGKTLDAAIARVRALRDAAFNLPGVAQADQLDGGQRKTFDDAKKRLVDADDSLTSFVGLQAFISAYLSFREIVPFSTIRTKEKTGRFGKGKGESRFIDILREGEQEPEAVSDENLLEAIRSLFDVTGVAMMAVETNPELAQKMAPGVDPKPDPALRMALVWRQHTASIAMSFPKCHARVKDTLAAENVSQLVIAELVKDIDYDRKTAQSAADGAQKARDNIATLSPGYRKPEYLDADYLGAAGYRVFHDTMTEACDEALYWVDKGIEQSAALVKVRGQTSSEFEGHKAPFESIRQRVQGILTPVVDAPETSKTRRKPTVDYNRTRVLTEEPTKPPEKRKADRGSDGASRKKQKATKGDDPGSSTQTMAVQVVLGKDDKIDDVKVGGRPPSPFPGTMGAHTTAWVVHVDHVRSTVRTKDARAAIQRVHEQLVPDVDRMFDEIGKDRDVRSAHQQAYEDSKTTLEELDEQSGDEADPLFLQTFIHALLTCINYIPGSALRKNDTRGHGEGTYRNLLVEHEEKENQDPSTLDAAIRALLDSNKSGPLWKNHLRIIRQTYPKSYRAAGYIEE